MTKKVLEPPRLLLIKSVEDEEELLIPFFADPNVNRYLGDGKPRDVEKVSDSISKHNKHWDAFGYGFFSIFNKETKEFVGRCGLVHLGMQHDHPDVEIGYMLYEKFWGKGYVTEVARRLLKWGFEELKLPSIIGVTRKENEASQRVLKKLGMHPRGEDLYPGTQVVCDYYEVNPESAILS